MCDKWLCMRYYWSETNSNVPLLIYFCVAFRGINACNTNIHLCNIDGNEVERLITWSLAIIIARKIAR